MWRIFDSSLYRESYQTRLNLRGVGWTAPHSLYTHMKPYTLSTCPKRIVSGLLAYFWKGRKDRQTGIYIPKSQWLVKEQCVKPTHPQAGTLNLRLQEIKNAVIQRRNLLVAKGLDYTIDDLLSENGRDNGRASEVLSYGSSLSSIPYTIPRSQVPFSILLYPSYCFIQRYYILLICHPFSLEKKASPKKNESATLPSGTGSFLT